MNIFTFLWVYIDPYIIQQPPNRLQIASKRFLVDGRARAWVTDLPQRLRGALLHLLTDPAGYPNGKYLSSVDFDRENGIEWKNPLIDA